MTYKCSDIENLNPLFIKLSQTNKFDLSQNFDNLDMNISLLRRKSFEYFWGM